MNALQRHAMSQKTSNVYSQQLKNPPWPKEPVSVRFSHWKYFRNGEITFGGTAGYSFIDEKGNSYQCSPGYQPSDIKLLSTGEDWSCYEHTLKKAAF